MDLPDELWGVPAGAAIMALVAVFEQTGLPSRFAGVTAIALATLVGTLFLLLAGQPSLLAVGKAFVWGLGIVAVHASVIAPLKQSSNS